MPRVTDITESLDPRASPVLVGSIQHPNPPTGNSANASVLGEPFLNGCQGLSRVSSSTLVNGSVAVSSRHSAARTMSRCMSAAPGAPRFLPRSWGVNRTRGGFTNPLVRGSWRSRPSGCRPLQGRG